LTNISEPVVGARFLGDTHFVASVDQRANIKIWDYFANKKGGLVIQSIKMEKNTIAKDGVNGLLMLTPSKIAVISKRLFFFERVIK